MPIYDEDIEGLSKINRQELLNPLDYHNQITANVHQLPYLYHFDIEKHRHPPSKYLESVKKVDLKKFYFLALCTLYDVQVSSSSLIWKMLDSGIPTCHTFMPYFGRNKCLATGFTRLFCPIEENISIDDRLQLSPYLKTTNHVEHLTLAVTGGRHVDMSLSNDQTRPAEQIKILLLQGHLTVTDINLNLPIRVEYGWNCDDFSLAVPAGFSATRYRRFDGENFAIYEGNSVITLPSCFRVIPVLGQLLSPILSNTVIPPIVEHESDEEPVTITNSAKPEMVIDSNITNPANSEILIDLNITNSITEDEQNVTSNFWNILRNKNSM